MRKAHARMRTHPFTFKVTFPKMGSDLNLEMTTPGHIGMRAGAVYSIVLLLNSTVLRLC